MCFHYNTDEKRKTASDTVCAECARSPHDWVGFLWVIWFPPPFQSYALEVDGLSAVWVIVGVSLRGPVMEERPARVRPMLCPELLQSAVAILDPGLE